MNGKHPSPYGARPPMRAYRLWENHAPPLSYLEVELTERCNNDCIHCYINLPEDDAEAKRRELGAFEIKKILTEAAALGALSVRFTGGEPLIREDFPELYLFARKLGLKVVLSTNARLITPELADLFVRTPPLVKIEARIVSAPRPRAPENAPAEELCILTVADNGSGP